MSPCCSSFGLNRRNYELRLIGRYRWYFDRGRASMAAISTIMIIAGLWVCVGSVSAAESHRTPSSEADSRRVPHSPGGDERIVDILGNSNTPIQVNLGSMIGPDQIATSPLLRGLRANYILQPIYNHPPTITLSGASGWMNTLQDPSESCTVLRSGRDDGSPGVGPTAIESRTWFITHPQTLVDPVNLTQHSDRCTWAEAYIIPFGSSTTGPAIFYLACRKSRSERRSTSRMAPSCIEIYQRSQRSDFGRQLTVQGLRSRLELFTPLANENGIQVLAPARVVEPMRTRSEPQPARGTASERKR